MSLNDNTLYNITHKQSDERHPVELYISATLDLAGLTAGTYYFNNKNNFEYLLSKTRNSLISIDDTSIISEVVVYANEPLKFHSHCNDDYVLRIGGSLGPINNFNNPVAVPWAGITSSLIPIPSPPSYSWKDLDVAEVNKGVVNYFGHEGGHFPYYRNLSNVYDPSDLYRYLAIEILQTQNHQTSPSSHCSSPHCSPRNINSENTQSSQNRIVQRMRNERNRQPYYHHNSAVFSSGKITVTIKLYPKFQ